MKESVINNQNSVEKESEWVNISPENITQGRLDSVQETTKEVDTSINKSIYK